MTTNINVNPTVSLAEAVSLIALHGHLKTYLLESGPGIGKTSQLKTLAKLLPTHRCFYYDATTKAPGDDIMPLIKEVSFGGVVRSAVHEDLGFHIDGPIILMIDEIGKAQSGVKNALMRIMLERCFGDRRLHDDSIVFATTNSAGNGLGDMLQAHHRNRIAALSVRGPVEVEWRQWAEVNNVNPTLISAIHEQPAFFGCYTDHADPKENIYIFDPRDRTRMQFVTPRSLAMCSPAVDSYEQGKINANLLLADLYGTIGPAAALIHNIILMQDACPRFDDIMANPTGCKIPPESMAGARILSTHVCALRSTATTFPTVWKYVVRMPLEIQAMAARMILESPKKASWALGRPELTQWVMKNANIVA